MREDGGCNPATVLLTPNIGFSPNSALVLLLLSPGNTYFPLIWGPGKD